MSENEKEEVEVVDKVQTVDPDVKSEVENIEDKKDDKKTTNPIYVICPLSEEAHYDELKELVEAITKLEKASPSSDDEDAEEEPSENANNINSEKIKKIKQDIYKISSSLDVPISIPEKGDFLKKKNLSVMRNGISTDMSGFGKTISDPQQALLAINMLSNGVRRVELKHSGFWVVMQESSLTSMYNFFKRVSVERSIMGASLGYYAHLAHDVLLKKTFMDELPSMVVQSNLKNWQKGNTLVNNISFHDYPLLLLTASELSSPNETVEIFCPNCTSSESVPMDLSEMWLFNIGEYPAAALEYVRDETERTPNDLQYFYNLIKDVNCGEVVHENYIFTLKTPMMNSVIQTGRNIVSNMETILGSTELSLHDQKVLDQSILTMSDNYIPFVESIRLVTGSVFVKESIPTALSSILEKDREDELSKKLRKAILNMKYGTVGHSVPKCKKCESARSDTNYVNWDPTEVFFDLTYRKLAQSGISAKKD